VPSALVPDCGAQIMVTLFPFLQRLGAVRFT